MSVLPQTEMAALSAENETELSMEEAYSILSSERRRMVVGLLMEKPEPVPLSDLATQVALLEEESRDDEVRDDKYKSVYVSLYQNHIPRMEDAGLIQRDDHDRLQGTSLLEELARMDQMATAGLLDHVGQAVKRWLLTR